MIIKNYIKHPIKSTYSALVQHQLLNWMSDESYLKLMYKNAFGSSLDLRHPETFNEKIQWLKLHDRKSVYSTMVDKYEVKQFVTELIGEEYIIPSIGVWNIFDKMNFDTLPDQFVLKTTHDSGGVVVCRDKRKFDIISAKKKLEPKLGKNYYWYSREWPYKNVKPRLVVEKFMKDGDNENLPVYKIMNFNGKPKIIQTIQNDKTPNETIDYFDTEWNCLPFKQNFPNSKRLLEKPSQLEKMLSLAEKLSAGFPFIRTDFYVINGEIYFSEFTFYSDSGFAKFEPEEWDTQLGNMIELPKGEDNGTGDCYSI